MVTRWVRAQPVGNGIPRTLPCPPAQTRQAGRPHDITIAHSRPVPRTFRTVPRASRGRKERLLGANFSVSDCVMHTRFRVFSARLTW